MIAKYPKSFGVFFSVFHRRLAGLFFEQFAKIGVIFDPHPSGDGIDRIVGGAEQVIGFALGIIAVVLLKI